MKKNRLLIAAAFLVVLLITLYATSREPKPEEFHSPFGKVKLEDIDGLEIRRPADPTATVMKKQGTDWRVVEPLESRADARTIQTALEKLRDLEVVDIASESKDSHHNLEVDDAHAVHVIARKGSAVLLDFWIGAFKSNFTMIRRPDDDRVYRASGSLKFNFDKALKDWRDRVIFDLDAEKFARVEFHSKNGNFMFNRGEGSWTVDGPEIPEFDFHKVSSIVTTLAKLRATDFADRVPRAQTGLDGDAVDTVRFRMKDDQTQYVLRIGNSVTQGTQEQFYAQREGTDAVFLISKYLANRLRPDAAKLKGRPRGDGGPAGPEPPAMPGMPPGMPGGPGAAGGPGKTPPGQIPPEIMQQLQQQMRANRRMSGSANEQ